ncbi:quinone oxidoreductase [Blastococcus sp. TF02A-30]|uniref:quinone oxidoreductase family protein n=1 Tax=Blastococcus sp. TF02A-30 TaxID=2250580 RepID=UPI000DEB998A|nr:quinone oxidoreductase [Blastococcus sp. TF02A-30]RBY92978.1 quinone oxidoreductase [Blastococcus sp. TF02A-30]
MRAVLVNEFGGPEVLRIGSAELRPMAPGDVHVRVAYAGVNFLDLHHRSGVYQRPLPFVPGREGAGTVLACGDAVTHLSPGDRVAFAMHEDGTYAEEAVIPAWKVARIPDDVELRTAAAVMLQGLTALSLVSVEARVRAGQTVLVHSAAGGTGSLVVQVARNAGARVLALASTEEKVAAALRAGASDASTYPEGGFAAWVRERTGGRGVDAVFDAVGGPTFDDDLDSLAVRGRLIVYGRSGGPFPRLDPARLANGCLSLTYSRLSYYTGTFEDFQERAAGLFDLVSRGAVAPLQLTAVPLDQAPAAHAALAARTSLGKHVLDLAKGPVPA